MSGRSRTAVKIFAVLRDSIKENQPYTGCTNIPEIYEPPTISGHQNGDSALPYIVPEFVWRARAEPRKEGEVNTENGE
jgi:hypothetical protein